MDSVYLKIAGITLKITSEVKGVIDRFSEMYKHYLSPDKNDDCYTLSIVVDNMEKYIQTDLLPFNGTAKVKTHYFYSAAYDKEKKTATLIAGIDNVYSFSEEYLVNWFSSICIENSCLLFHAAVLIDEHENAYLFYGPSGIGKSTISRNNHFWKKITDDLIVIKKNKKGKYDLLKTPFERDKSKFDETSSFKIQGFYRLHQSDQFELQPQTKAHQLSAIVGNIWNPDFTKVSFADITKLSSDLITDVPGYDLFCSKDELLLDKLN